MSRVALFVYDLPLYSFIKDFALKLAASGYWVDVFSGGWDLDPRFEGAVELRRHGAIRHFDFTQQPTTRRRLVRRIKKLRSIVAMLFGLSCNDRPEDIIDPMTRRASEQVVSALQYVCLIGIDREGLIWAGLLSEAAQCPIFYYSLHLYTQDHPQFFTVYHLRQAESIFHKKALGTIIQDAGRAKILLKNNGVEGKNVLHFPISVRGDPVRERSRYLHDEFGIPDEHRILLYYGSLYRSRFLMPILRIAAGLGDDVALVVHGFGPDRYIRRLRAFGERRKVVFSLDFIPESEISRLVSSADIGIALYSIAHANHRLVALSSSKMAHYTQCGIPVIAFDTESFRNVMARHKCGELIETVDEMPLAVRKILANYEAYRHEAYLAYGTFYNFDNNFSQFLEPFEALLARHRTRATPGGVQP